uniref:DUF659 domain-containing protein n=1 Tax=Ciona savignyi TaxID=51511 RepID=H2Z2I2_CIOSA
MPIHIVESKGFVDFLKVVNPRYKPMSQITVRKRVLLNSEALKQRIIGLLSTCGVVNITLDIWSDRQLRAFLGVTAHFIDDSNGSFKLCSVNLETQRFNGRHSGENFATAFETVLHEYSIKNKINYVINDNAAKMKRAFTTNFPREDNDSQPLVKTEHCFE